MNSSPRRCGRILCTLAALLVITLMLAPSAHATPKDAVTAGTMIRISTLPGGFEYGCTVGFTGHDRHGQAIAVTAGHCAPDHPSVPAFFDFSTVPAGTLIAVSPLNGLDFAAVRLQHGISAATSILAAPPRVGTIVCKVGRVSGRTCGPITAVSPTTVTALIRVVWGDSGGALIDADGRTIAITSHAAIAHQATDPAPAMQQFARSMLGGPTTPTVFVRTDAIATQLQTLGLLMTTRSAPEQ